MSEKSHNTRQADRLDRSTAAMATLQPMLSFEAITDQSVEIKAPQILHDVNHLVRFWSDNQENLPEYFSEEFKLTKVVRQPLFFLCVDTQKVQRTAEAFEEPYDGGYVDQNPWPHDDLFQSIPLDATAFPTQQTSERVLVGGRQKLLPCRKCGTEGSTTCSQCEGAGGQACSQCSGECRSVCDLCEGSGSLIGDRAQLHECALCTGTGTIACNRCSGRGHVSCAHCEGEGSITCESCAGSGQLKQSWAVRSEIATVSRYQLVGTPSVPSFATELAATSHQIEGGQFDLLENDDWKQRLTDLIPQQVSWMASDMISKAFAEVQARNNSQIKITGLRVGVRATYLYRIELDHLGKAFVIYLGGNTNEIFAKTLPQRSRSIFARMQRSIDRFFTLVGLGERQEEDGKFVTGVHDQNIHIADKNLLGSELRKLGLGVHLSESGYDIEIELETSEGLPSTSSLKLQFEVERTGQALLSARCDLGKAARELFPQALEMNQNFDFGRIALVKDSQTTEERFIFVDIRPYGNVRAADYYLILLDLSHDAQTISEILTKNDPH